MNIKEEFKKWLVQNGVAEKTSTGKPGAAYDYTRLIDKICDIIYIRHDIEQWHHLALNIYLVLGIHLLCKKNDIVITKDNADLFKDFLSEYLIAMKPYQNNLHHYLRIVFCRDDECDGIEDYEYILRRLHYLLKDEKIICSFSGTQNQKRKHHVVLKKFFKFLQNGKYTDQSLYAKLASKGLENIQDYYKDLANRLDQIGLPIQESIPANRNIELKIKDGNGLNPPQFEPSFSGDDEATLARIEKFLSIERHALTKLFKKSSNGKISIEDVNDFVLNNFHPSENASATSLCVEKWWTAREASEKTGLHIKKIQRLRKEGKISYIQLSKERFLHYPYDFAEYAKKPIVI